MRVNQKIFSTFLVVFGIITTGLAILSLFNYVSVKVVIIFLGLTQIVSGLNQIILSKHMNSKGKSKGSKSIGVISIILGIGILILMTIKTNI